VTDVDALVIGGGVSGLAAASRLHELGRDVVILEASDEVGGKLRSHIVGELQLDAGAESVLVRRPEALDLIADAGRLQDLEHPAVSGAGLWTDRILPLPREQLLGVPTDVDDADLERVLGAAGVEAIRREPEFALTAGVRADSADQADDCVGGVVRRQLGDAVVELLVEPLLGGVYAGHADDISIDMAVPGLLAAAQRTGSLVRGARELRAASAAQAVSDSVHVFASVRGGLGQLGAALVGHQGIAVRRATTATAVRHHRSKWRVTTADGESFDTAAVVMAVPSFVAAPLLAELSNGAAVVADQIEYASVALVTTVFDRSTLPNLPTGTGFLVPPATGRLVKAATFVSQKWQWVRDAAPELDVLRFSVGRHGDERAEGASADELTAAVLDEIGEVLGLTTAPVASAVTRWPRSLPQYRPGHRARVRVVKAGIPRGIALAGAAWDGIGIPACIASGRAAAESVVDDEAVGGQ
jgi:oxygen-dependent protoporphyrinogen oxidase